MTTYCGIDICSEPNEVSQDVNVAPHGRQVNTGFS